jgi:hypothetical protein
MIPCHPKNKNQLNWVTIKLLELASKNVMVMDQSKGFFFFKKWKNLLQRKTSYRKGKGTGGDKPKSIKSPKFTKRYYHSKVVGNTI